MTEGPVVLHDLQARPSRLEAFLRGWREKHGGSGALDWAAALIELRPARLFSSDAARG